MPDEPRRSVQASGPRPVASAAMAPDSWGSRAAQLARVGEVEVLTWPMLAELGVDAAFTARDGGVSTGPYRSLNLGLHVGDDPAAVAENRRRAATALGASVDDFVFGMQVHGAHAAIVTARDAGRGARATADALADTDALVTAERGPVLVTLVADCSPILLVDPDARVLATVHAGWRGAVRDAVGATINAMAALGASARRIVAVIGPTVSPTGYVVGPEVEAAVRSSLGDAAQTVLWQHGDRWRLDVCGANRAQLVAAGVAPGSVHLSPYATGDGRFFSDRAARPCGRFGLLARLR